MLGETSSQSVEQAARLDQVLQKGELLKIYETHSGIPVRSNVKLNNWCDQNLTTFNQFSATGDA